jgi:hypothetical protein
MGGSPTSSVKRAAKADRDIATSVARLATVQARAGSRWISVIARPSCRSRSAPSHPVCAAGSCSIQARMAWITRTSARPGDDRLAPRPQLLDFGRHEAQRALDPLRLGRIRRLDADHPRQDADEVTRGWVVEADGAADETRRRAAAAVLDDLVPLAELLAGDIEEPRAGHAGLTRQPVSLPMGHQSEVARLQRAGLDSVDLEPAPTRRHHVEHQRVRHCRQRQGPRRGEVAAAVKGAAHPQDVERFPEGVHRRPWFAHARESRRREPLRPEILDEWS